jgi:AcrR family transcriptional regulator
MPSPCSSDGDRTYHHGHLREDLMTRALETLERDGAQAISLRALALDCGVSKTAPYRHFPDRDALLHALMLHGWRDLHAALSAASAASSSPLEGLSAMGRSYLDFALRRPGMYRLLFTGAGQTLAAARGCPEGTDSFALLADQVAQAQAQGWKASVPTIQVALSIWALVHGTADLALEGLADPPAGIERLDFWSEVLSTLVPR